MSLFFFFLSFLDGLDTLISNIKTANRKFITMHLNEKDSHGKFPSFFFFFQFLGFNALFMGINYVSDGIAILINFDGVSRAMTAKNLQKVC